MPKYIRAAVQIITVDEAYEKFIKSRKAKNVSIRTVKFYEENFKLLQTFVDTKATNIADLNEEFVDDYSIYLQDNTKRNMNSINTALRSLRAFMYFCMERKYIAKFEIHMASTDKCHKQNHTDEEIEKLLKEPINNKFCTWRNYAIVQYLLSTGNRAENVVRLKIEDIDFDKSIINIRTSKNRQGYELVISIELTNALKYYLSLWKHEPSDYLFPNERDNAKGITVSGLQNAIRDYCIERNVENKGLHVFRYTYARKYMSKGGKIENLSYQLGHCNLGMTRRYLKPNTELVREDIEKMKFLD